MTTERILERHQRCKEMTRLRRGCAPGRLFAGLTAALTGRRILRLYRRSRPSLPDPLDPAGRYVLSLTSFPPRMQYLWVVIDLLMRQKERPAAVFLTLFSGDFPDHVLPASLDPYLERGLQIIWAEEDLKPHLKYFHIFRKELEGEGRPVITVDDDLFYAPDTAGRLLALSETHPGAVCANLVRRISGDRYADWPILTAASGPSMDLLALGFGGVLYPRSFYGSAEIYDLDAIRSSCLKADDLWLRVCEDRCGVPVVTGSFFAHPAEVPSSQAVSLYSTNVAGEGNDRVWKALHGE